MYRALLIYIGYCPLYIGHCPYKYGAAPINRAFWSQALYIHSLPDPVYVTLIRGDPAMLYALSGPIYTPYVRDHVCVAPLSGPSHFTCSHSYTHICLLFFYFFFVFDSFTCMTCRSLHMCATLNPPATFTRIRSPRSALPLYIAQPQALYIRPHVWDPLYSLSGPSYFMYSRGVICKN